ncbi:hypothetical protein L1887_61165 [Cichorium endivia]|nr:hypothetical protein L1887_61165 [Cichorium endivia]
MRISSLSLVDLELVGAVLAEALDVVERFGVARRFEDIVELLLQARGLGEGPIAVFLMAEDDVLEDGPGDAEEPWDLLVELGALCGEGAALSGLGIIVGDLEQALERLHGEAAALFARDLKVTDAVHADLVGGVEAQTHLGLDFVGGGHLRVVHKCAALGVGWKVAGGGILEAFDDRGLAAAVVADDDGERLEELDDVDRLVVEGADAANGELVERSHLCWKGRRAVEVMPRRQASRRRRGAWCPGEQSQWPWEGDGEEGGAGHPESEAAAESRACGDQHFFRARPLGRRAQTAQGLAHVLPGPRIVIWRGGRQSAHPTCDLPTWTPSSSALPDHLSFASHAIIARRLRCRSVPIRARGPAIRPTRRQVAQCTSRTSHGLHMRCQGPARPQLAQVRLSQPALGAVRLHLGLISFAYLTVTISLALRYHLARKHEWGSAIIELLLSTALAGGAVWSFVVAVFRDPGSPGRSGDRERWGGARPASEYELGGEPEEEAQSLMRRQHPEQGRPSGDVDHHDRQDEQDGGAARAALFSVPIPGQPQYPARVGSGAAGGPAAAAEPRLVGNRRSNRATRQHLGQVERRVALVQQVRCAQAGSLSPLQHLQALYGALLRVLLPGDRTRAAAVRRVRAERL